MRLFFAVEIPEEVRRNIAAGVAELRRRLPAARWVRPEGVHLTLKFLGEQPETLIEPLHREVCQALAGLRPVTVALAGGGFFPSAKRARVAWLGGQAEGLEEWAQTLERCARRHRVSEEERPFAVHLTLARLERPWPVEEVEKFLGIVQEWRLAPFVAREVVLFASQLGPGGARYTPLRRIGVGEGRKEGVSDS